MTTKKKRIFSLKSENFAEFIVQQKILNNGSKWQYAITKRFKSVSGYVLLWQIRDIFLRNKSCRLWFMLNMEGKGMVSTNTFFAI